MKVRLDHEITISSFSLNILFYVIKGAIKYKNMLLIYLFHKSYFDAICNDC